MNNNASTADIATTDWRESWAYLIGKQACAYGFPAIYLPGEAVMDQSYVPPPVRRVS